MLYHAAGKLIKFLNHLLEVLIIVFNLAVDWVHWQREQAYHNMLINLRRYIKNENANKREL